MIVRDISLDSPLENIVYDDVLLQLAEDQIIGDTLRFWESSQFFIVLGKIGKVDDDVDLNNVQRDHVPIYRRSSGGGTVLQGPGCLNYSLILSKDTFHQLNDLRQSYTFILGKIVQALKDINIEAEWLPISDIALIQSQKKISGNAQKRARRNILHHGTLLYNFDIRKISQYLRTPKNMPVYRKDRKHRDFVENLKVSSQKLKKQIQCVFDCREEESEVSERENILLHEFMKNKKYCVKV